MRIGRKLAKAVTKGDVDAVRGLLEPARKRAPLYIHPDINLALIDACKLGHKEVAELLLDLGAMIDARDVMGTCAPLRLACSGGHVALIAMLISRGAKVDGEVLEWAVQKQQPASVSALLARCPFRATEIDHALVPAAKGGSVGIINMLLQRGADVRTNGNRPLHVAALHNRAGAVTMLLARGADIHDKKDFAVRTAACFGHSRTVRLLLAHGADQSVALHGELLRQVRLGDIESIRKVVKRGENLRDENDWALRLALEQSPHIAEELVELGDYRNVHCDLALIAFAVTGNHSEVAKLMRNGADPCAENHRALREAARLRHTMVIDRIVSRSDIVRIKEATREMRDEEELLVRTRFVAAQARNALKDPGIEL